MRFRIKDIGDEGVAINLVATAAWVQEQCPNLDARPGHKGVTLRGRLQKMGDDFLLHGELRGIMEMACSRCLEPAEVRLEVPLSVTFTFDEPDEKDGNPEDPDVVTIDGDEIDLGVELRDELLLAMPLSTLCRSECAGLCPVCGGNRNQTPCDCEERERMRSSKLASLGKLKM